MLWLGLQVFDLEPFFLVLLITIPTRCLCVVLFCCLFAEDVCMKKCKVRANLTFRIMRKFLRLLRLYETMCAH